jgi:ATP-dependent exoDNAse (exonuclease V) beta subunit
VILVDEAQRRRALTSLDENLLVEAAAGTGKTALMAGRISMLLATGESPRSIAAITFTELAASELSVRISRMIESLLIGEIPRELQIVLPDGLDDSQRAHLTVAASTMDELTISTIHGFCQNAIRSYAIEASLDPGSRVIDAAGADTMFEAVLSEWLIDRLSSDTRSDDPIAVLSKDDPLGVIKLIRELADIKRRHPTATASETGMGERPDIDFCQAVDEFERWLSTTPGEKSTADWVRDLRTLADFYSDSLTSRPAFDQLWRLARPPSVECMKFRSYDLKPYQRRTSWVRSYGKDSGQKYSEAAEKYFAVVNEAYQTLLGAIGASLVAALSSSLDDVLALYTARKRAAAVMDFEDLLSHAYELVHRHEAIRSALAMRYKHIFVDEFQDTDRIQAAIVFLIAAETRMERWQDARLRPGSLFLVGDPKQAIYRFRGADVAAYEQARSAMRRQADDCIVQVTANFRSRREILAHVNTCFESVLNATGQPGYVKLSATIEETSLDVPCAAKVIIDIPDISNSSRGPSAADQREAEAALVADVCRRLVGAVTIVRDDGRRTPLVPGDIALLAPTGTDLWRYERALETQGLSVASQAGKTLMLRQETQDVLCLLRSLADPFDTVAFGALMRGPLVGLTEEQILDIADAINACPDSEVVRHGFRLTTPLEWVVLPLAKWVLGHLQYLRKRVAVTTPLIVLSEAIERLQLRLVLAARYRNRGARALANLDALIEKARPYGIAGLGAFVIALQDDWEQKTGSSEGRIDASDEAVQIVTIHSSKGLEWPVVIPINTSTVIRSPPQFVHLQSNNTLHWVIGGVASPSLAAAREEEGRSESQERQRMWYVACTRARDMLVLPELPLASSQSWSRIVDLAHGALPVLDLSNLAAPKTAPTISAANGQTAAIFAAEASRAIAAAPDLVWRRPSEHDPDRALALDMSISNVDGTFEFVQPLGAGRLRGVLLHKLLEELLSGELIESADVVTQRAHELLVQLLGMSPEGDEPAPDPKEAVETVLRTLRFPEIAAIRPTLVAEVPIWAGSINEGYLAGRADAVSVVEGRVHAVIDWKSDVRPSATERSGYRGQLSEYMAAIGTNRGALVYMSLGQIEWIVLGDAPQSSPV